MEGTVTVLSHPSPIPWMFASKLEKLIVRCKYCVFQGPICTWRNMAFLTEAGAEVYIIFTLSVSESTSLNKRSVFSFTHASFIWMFRDTSACFYTFYYVSQGQCARSLCDCEHCDKLVPLGLNLYFMLCLENVLDCCGTTVGVEARSL